MTTTDEITQQGIENRRLVFRRLAQIYREKWMRRVGEGDELKASKELWARSLSEFSEDAVKRAIRDIERGIVVFVYEAPDVGQFSQIARQHNKPGAPVLSISQAARIENGINEMKEKLNAAYVAFSAENDRKRKLKIYEDIERLSAQISTDELLLSKCKRVDQ